MKELTEVQEVIENEVVQEVEQVEMTTFEELQQLKKEYEEQTILLAELKKQAQENERAAFNMQLKNEGLEMFGELFNTTDKAKQIEVLKNAVNQLLVQHSYVPSDMAKQDAYDTAIQNGDVQGALKTKFAKFFGM